MRIFFMFVTTVFILSGCGVTDPYKKIEFLPAGEISFTSAKSPANITSRKESELKQAGYVRIGDLAVELSVKRCLPNSRTNQQECFDIPQPEDATTLLLKEAAMRGANLVQLAANNTTGTRSFSRLDSNCAEWGQAPAAAYVYNYSTKSMEYRITNQRSCIRWKLIEETQTIKTSKGVIWAHAPELARTLVRNDAFVSAAEKGDTNKIKLYLSQGMAADIKDSKGRLASYMAAINNHKNIIQLLISKGADINTTGSSGGALHGAAKSGNMKLIRFLLKQGADVNLAATGGLTPLMLSAFNGHANATRLLLENGADHEKRLSSFENSTALILAIISNDLKTVVALLKFDADPLAKTSAGVTALQLADMGISNRDIYRVMLGYAHGLYGFMDRTWKIRIKPQYDGVKDFSEGLAAVELESENWGPKYGYIDRNGKQIIKFRFKEAGPFHEGLAAVNARNFLGGKKGFINKKGRMVIKDRFSDAGDFSEGLAPVKLDGKWGYINRRGKFRIKPKYDNAHPFSEGLASVMIGDLWGSIDKKGRIVIKPQFSLPVDFSEGLAVAKMKKNYGYINRQGKFVITPQFSYADNFSEGLAVARKGENYGYINKNGKFAIPPRFTYAEPFSEGLAEVSVATLFGPLISSNPPSYIDKTGKELFSSEFIYGNFGNKGFSNGLTRVKIHGKEFLKQVKADSSYPVLKTLF